MSTTVTQSDWIKGISLSVLASILGSASKLAIRKSWLLQASMRRNPSTSQLSADLLIQDEQEVVGRAESGPLAHRVRLFQTFFLKRSLGWFEFDADSTGVHSEQLYLWKPYALRLSGMLGMSIFNPVCCVLAMNYASPSILAPFSGLTLVWIILLSDRLIHEPASPIQMIAASFIVMGEVTISIYGDHTNARGATIQDVRESYLYPPFLVFLALIAIWMALLFQMMTARSLMLKRFAWGVAGGSVTGLQNFLKDSLTVLKDSQQNRGTTLPWWFYLLIGLAAMSAFSGLLLLTACMKRYDVTFSSATFVGSFIMSASIMSVIHYDTFENLKSTSSYVMYPVGLLILMTGVGLLIQDASDDGSSRIEPVNEASDNTLQQPLIFVPAATWQSEIVEDEENAG